MREVISDLHERLTGEELPTVTIREFVKSWLERKGPETADSTLKFYAGSTSKFLEFLGDDGDRVVSEISAKQILAFRNSESRKLAAKTVNHDLKCLKMLFKAARREGLISEDPSEFVDTVRDQDDKKLERRPFKIEEINAALAVADPEWKSMIMFGLYTGQRLGDVSTLLRCNVDLEAKRLKFITRKTKRRMSIPLAPPLLEFLIESELPERPEAPLHPEAHDIVTVQKKSGSLSNKFTRLLARAGLREKPSNKGTGKGRDAKRVYHPLSFHSLRHTATSMLHEAGVPPAVAQALIGHDSEAIHQVYVSVGDKALQDAAGSFPLVGKVS
ncbi:MAG: tyrosine-type recombinase/integrase [Verrucomicrobiales bacterium]|nr:site-specific integrase [Verrucomicrobiae bacterium]